MHPLTHPPIYIKVKKIIVVVFFLFFQDVLHVPVFLLFPASATIPCEKV